MKWLREDFFLYSSRKYSNTLSTWCSLIAYHHLIALASFGCFFVASVFALHETPIRVSTPVSIHVCHQEENARVAAASQLIANTIASCCCWGCTFVSIVLAVNAITGADYSAFVIFIPLFVIAGLLVCCMTCIICCARGMPGEDLGESIIPLGA